MYVFDSYRRVTDNLHEGFAGLQGEVTGWDSSYPKSLTFKGTIDPETFLQECEGLPLEGGRYEPTTLELLVFAHERFTIDGDLARDAEKWFAPYGSGAVDNATPLQAKVFHDIVRIINHLWNGVQEDWEVISDVLYGLSDSKKLRLPSGVHLPEGVSSIELEKVSYHAGEYVVETDFATENDIHLDNEVYDIKEGNAHAGQLRLSLYDAKGELIEEFESDGVFVWHDDEALAAFLNHLLGTEESLQEAA